MPSTAINIFEDVLNIDPVYFIESHRTIKGEDFKIMGSGREYLVDLYRYCCIGAIQDGKSVVVVKGRQVEMTEAALNIALYYLKNYSHFTVLHAFPRKEQVSRYSRDRLQVAVRDSRDGKLKDLKANHPNASDTVSNVEFKNDSRYYMYSAWGDADALRGIPADLLCRDEFQDWSASAIANTDANLHASKYKIEFSFGTPKLAGAKFEELWENSDQRYYHLKCVKCSHFFQITLDNYKYKFTVECPKCKELQDKRLSVRGGKWIPTKDSKTSIRVGFHISQLLSPIITRESINKSKAEYSEARFKNEVLGEFYTGAGVPLEYGAVVAKCCEPYMAQDFPINALPPKVTYMGIDWGSRSDEKDRGAYTVVTIIEKVGNDYNVVYTERLLMADMAKQVKRIENLAGQYNCISIVADLGFGGMQVQELQKIFKDRAKSCFYNINVKNRISYNKDTWMLSVDRDSFLEELVDIITSGRLHVPWRHPEKCDWFIKQICNTAVDIRINAGNVRRKYDKLDNAQPNDAFHSLNYAYLASITHLGQSGFGLHSIPAKVGTGMPAPVGANFSGKLGGSGSAAGNMFSNLRKMAGQQKPVNPMTRNDYRR